MSASLLCLAVPKSPITGARILLQHCYTGGLDFYGGRATVAIWLERILEAEAANRSRISAEWWLMTGLLETRNNASSPFASRVVQSPFSLEEAERDAIQVYYGSLTKRTLVSALVALFFLFIMGYSAVNARAIAMATEFKVAGTVLLSICAAGLAYVIYEYRRKQRVFILEDSFAVERRFSFEVELIRWTDVAKLYCLDRTTETKLSLSISCPWPARRSTTGS